MIGTIESGKSQLLQNNNINNTINNNNNSEIKNSNAINEDDEIRNGIAEQEDNQIFNDDLLSDNCNSPSDDISLQSFSSDIELIEEIILLPNNIYSDDENTSNDNDCIYAYRGTNNSNNNINNINNNPAPQQDDETDFLEMDFDPEPSSEQENFVEIPEFHNFNQNFIVMCSNDANTSNAAGDATLFEAKSQQSDVVANAMAFGPEQTSVDLSVIPSCSKTSNTTLFARPSTSSAITTYFASTSHRQTSNSNPGIAPPSTSSSSSSSSSAENDNKIPKLSVTENNKANQMRIKNTGTIPKMIMQNSNTMKLLNGNNNANDISCFRSSLKCNSKSRDNIKKSKDYNDTFASHRYDSNCLDCTENEFLMQNNRNLQVSEICKTCRRNNYYKDKFVHSINSNGINYNRNVPNSFDDHLKYNLPDPESRLSMPNSHADCDQVCTEKTVKEFQEITSFIHSLHCDDEKTICDALVRKIFVAFEFLDQRETAINNKVGVTPNLNVIAHYINEVTIDNATNVIEYLLYLSKRKCNYKKLMTTLKLCCDEDLEISFETINPGDQEIETIEVHSSEVYKRWTPNTNLRNLFMQIENKRFHELNVLGKIVHILRQGRDCNISFNIPQYYETGYIFIKRKI